MSRSDADTDVSSWCHGGAFTAVQAQWRLAQSGLAAPLQFAVEVKLLFDRYQAELASVLAVIALLLLNMLLARLGIDIRSLGLGDGFVSECLAPVLGLKKLALCALAVDATIITIPLGLVWLARRRFGWALLLAGGYCLDAVLCITATGLGSWWLIALLHGLVLCSLGQALVIQQRLRQLAAW